MHCRTLSRKFDRISYQVDQNLHNTQLVANVKVRQQVKLQYQLNSSHFSLVHQQVDGRFAHLLKIDLFLDRRKVLLLQQTHVERHVDLTQEQFGCIADHFDLALQFFIRQVVKRALIKQLVGHGDNASKGRYEFMSY